MYKEDFFSSFISKSQHYSNHSVIFGDAIHMTGHIYKHECHWTPIRHVNDELWCLSDHVQLQPILYRDHRQIHLGHSTLSTHTGSLVPRFGPFWRKLCNICSFYGENSPFQFKKFLTVIKVVFVWWLEGITITGLHDSRAAGASALGEPCKDAQESYCCQNIITYLLFYEQ